MRFFDLIEAEAFVTIMYHGTDVDYLKSIIKDKKGLVQSQPLTTRGKGRLANYLTPNINLAARYSAGGLSYGKQNRRAAILEIKLFQARRHNKMQSDPLDRASNAWRDHYDEDGEGEGDRETIHELHTDIENFIKRILKIYKISVPYIYLNFRPTDIEELQGFNLYDFIKTELAKYLKQDYVKVKNDISREIVRTFAHNSYGNEVELTDSGILKLSPDYFSGQHQVLYKKNIPTAAIKAVWVKKSDFPNVKGEEKQFGEELLPNEVVHKFEVKKHSLENLADNLRKAIDYYEQDKNEEDFNKEIKDIKEQLDDDDIIDLIDDIVSKVLEDESIEEELKHIDEEARGITDYLQDDYHTGTVIEQNKTTWVRVETNSPEINKIIK